VSPYSCTARRVLFLTARSADPRTLVAYLLGTAIPASSSSRVPAIVKIEKTPYDPEEVVSLTSPAAWEKLEVVR
jgi:hypothetical protein